MTNWWTFNALKQKFGRFQFLLLLCLFVGLVSYWSYQLGINTEKTLEKKVEQSDMRLSNLYQDVDGKTRQINYLSVELEVEKKANIHMQEELFTLREELFALRRELNFYQKVVAPELVANGISVEQFQVEKTNIEGRYKFRFALVQTNNKKRYAKGYIRLKLHATQNGTQVDFDFAELAGLNKDNLRFSFHYFQYFDGEFELKQGTTAEKLEIKVIQPKSKWQKYKAFTEVFDWPNF